MPYIDRTVWAWNLLALLGFETKKPQSFLTVNVHSSTPQHVQGGLMYLAQFILGEDSQLTELQIVATPTLASALGRHVHRIKV